MHTLNLFAFVLVASSSTLLFASRAEAQRIPEPPTAASSSHVRLQLQLGEPDSRPTALRLVEESLAWTATTGVAISVAVAGVFLGVGSGDSGSFAVFEVLALGIGVFGIPASVWVTGGKRGNYGDTQLGNLIGFTLGFAAFGISSAVGSGFDSEYARGPFIVTGIVLGGMINLAGALLGEQLSRHARSDLAPVAMVPVIAPTAHFDGVTVGMGGAF